MTKKDPKFVFILGGVISGLGKGIFTASLGKIFQWMGYNVNPIKIDPYLNADAGTMRPTEHGEVWVTYDGGEIDQDLGNYERFLKTALSKENNITSGKVFQRVIEKERSGEYLGKTVQYIPHVVDLIEEMLLSLHNKSGADVSLVEVGGTVGDYEGELFLHALSRMRSKYPIATILMGYLLLPPHIGELKSKPFQHAIRGLFSSGNPPDILVARAPQDPDDSRLSKLATASGLPLEAIVKLPDTKNIYEIPLNLLGNKTYWLERITNILSLKNKSSSNTFKNSVINYKNFVSKLKLLEESEQKVKIALVGKYFKAGDFTLTDSYISVIDSLKFASWANNTGIEFVWIDSTKIHKDASDAEIASLLNGASGIVVPGGFGSTGVEGKLRMIKYARKNKIPYLGLCYGLQLAVVEFARNVLGFGDANTTEIDPQTKYPVVDILPEQRKILEDSNYGATMRLGDYKAYLQKGTLVYELYKTRRRLLKDSFGKYVIERHRHRYEVNPQFHKDLIKGGLVFSGLSKDKRLVEFIELPREKHPFFVGTQAHPEFTSYPDDPNPLFWGFIKASLNGKDS